MTACDRETVAGALVTDTNPPHTPEARRPNGSFAPLAAAVAVARQARRLIVFVLGCSVLLAGLVMLITPGPALIFIPLGLGILATEFFWARRVLRWFQARVSRQMAALRRRGANPAAGAQPGPSRDQDKAA